jgi:hypothetical protein
VKKPGPKPGRGAWKQLLLDALRDGHSLIKACEIADIHLSNVHRAAAHDPAFAESLARIRKSSYPRGTWKEPFLNAIRVGLRMYEACQQVGISRTRVDTARKNDESFAVALQQARVAAKEQRRPLRPQTATPMASHPAPATKQTVSQRQEPQKRGRPLPDRKKLTTWDLKRVEHELRSFIAEHGTPGRMPTTKQLRQHHRVALISAIRRHGGLRAVASRLQLSRPGAAKPSGYWQNDENLKREIEDFLRLHSKPRDTMPTVPTLAKAGRKDLVSAIRHHGGTRNIAARLGFLCQEDTVLTTVDQTAELAWQVPFLTALAEGQTITEAARTAHISRSEVYLVAAQDNAFAAKWSDAKRAGKSNNTMRKQNQARFLQLRRTGLSVGAAAKAAGIGRATIYKWKACDSAFASALASIDTTQDDNEQETYS